MLVKIKLKKIADLCADWMTEQIKGLPETGAFPGLRVRFNYPDTEYSGYLTYEPSASDHDQRQIRTLLGPKDSDRVVSHFLCTGSNDQCIRWLQSEENRKILREDFEQMKQSVDKWD